MGGGVQVWPSDESDAARREHVQTRPRAPGCQPHYHLGLNLFNFNLGFDTGTPGPHPLALILPSKIVLQLEALAALPHTHTDDLGLTMNGAV